MREEVSMPLTTVDARRRLHRRLPRLRRVRSLQRQMPQLQGPLLSGQRRGRHLRDGRNEWRYLSARTIRSALFLHVHPRRMRRLRQEGRKVLEVHPGLHARERQMLAKSKQVINGFMPNVFIEYHY